MYKLVKLAMSASQVLKLSWHCVAPWLDRWWWYSHVHLLPLSLL